MRATILAGMAVVAALATLNVIRGPALPVVEAPDSYDLGYTDKDVQARIRLPIKNRGRADLELTGWRTNCSCIEVTHNGRTLDQRVSVAPGDSYDLDLSLTMKKGAYLPGSYSLHFLTNDPQHPHHTFTVTFNPVGALMATPSAIEFPLAAPLSEPRVLPVLVYSTHEGVDESIGKVEVTHPAFVHARTEPIVGGQVETLSYWRRLIARVFFSYQPGEHESVDLAVASIFDSKNDKKVMVSLEGKTNVAFRAYPSRVKLLPGTKGRVLVRFAESVPFVIESIDTPEVVSVTIQAGQETRYYWLEVESKNRLVHSLLQTVTIKAKSEGQIYATRLVVDRGVEP